jgi:hypothetical protein
MSRVGMVSPGRLKAISEKNSYYDNFKKPNSKVDPDKIWIMVGGVNLG